MVDLIWAFESNVPSNGPREALRMISGRLLLCSRLRPMGTAMGSLRHVALADCAIQFACFSLAATLQTETRP